ncbi:Dabb family protein [Jatrophihabitans sp. DSM 45814]
MSMLRHVVTIKFDGSVSPAQRSEIAASLLALGDDIADVQSLEFGMDVSNEEHSSDAVLIVDLADDAAYRRYEAHPAHIAATKLIGPALAGSSVLRYER